ncbi:minor tail protein [Shewanella phage vB_Sb_QDWS]|nr:minor tail protein [Shewanella phage vB_Sb_QDWS]
MMSRTVHFAQDDMTSIQLAYANWFAGDQTLPGAASTVTAAIEYPAGTIRQVTFNGQAAGTIGIRQTLTSDVLDCRIPRGAKFWVRTYQTNTWGVCYSSYQQQQNLGEASIITATGGVDLTMGGTITTNGIGTGNIYAPVAILGQTRRPSVFILGDSRVHGDTTTFPIPSIGTSDSGMIAPCLYPNIGYITCGSSGDSAANTATDNGVRRCDLALYATHVINEMGVNDITTDPTTVTSAFNNLQAINARFNGRPVWGTTLPPRCTSTDNFATLANQVQDARNPNIIAFNQRMRANWQSMGFAGYFDFADLYMSSRDSGLWIVNGTASAFTTDGTHPNFNGYQLARTSGIITSSMFVRS